MLVFQVHREGFQWQLDSYQEQPYLLDPFLEQLVAPAVEKLKEFARLSLADPNLKYDAWRANTIARIVYSYVKFRGHKTISQSHITRSVLRTSTEVLQSAISRTKSLISQSR